MSAVTLTGPSTGRPGLREDPKSMLATTTPKGMRTHSRTPGTFVRDISRAVQDGLDGAVRRAP